MFWGMPYMDGIATAPVELSLEAIAQKAALEATPATPGSPYRIPDGCRLRHTFLEWEDESEETVGRERRGARRSRSCPAEKAPEPCKLGCESLLSTRSPTSEAGTAPMEESFAFDGMPTEDASFLHMEPQWHTWPDMETWQEAESWRDAESWRQAESWRDTESWRETTESWRDTENWRETETWQEPEQDESAWAVAEWSEPTSKGREQKGRARGTPTFLVLRGLPFNSTEAEIRSFVENCGVHSDDLSADGGVVLLANAQGRPSGFAEVHLARAADFWQIQQLLHKQNLGGRYVEALEPRPARKPGGGSSRRSGKQWRR